MSWHPSDLLTDADLVAYEPRILSQFGVADWADLRAKVLDDWAWPHLRAAGFDPQRFRTRHVADAVLGYTSSAYTDLTSAAANTTTGDLNLATVLAASTDYLYVGSAAPFRGISVRVLDAVSSVSGTLSVALWRDAWVPVSAADGTQATGGKPFSGGGSVTWRVPAEWTARILNGTGPYYWARMSLSAAPTGATAAQLGVVRRSVLCAPVTFRALALIFRAAPLAQDGPWADRADWYEREADASLQRALGLLGGEFDTVTEDDVIDSEEAAQTTAEATGSAWSLDRA